MFQRNPHKQKHKTKQTCIQIDIPIMTQPQQQQQTITIDLTKECPKFKEAYNTCFHKWYQEEFLAGTATENICTEQWDDYKACMIVSVQEKELQVLLEKDFKKEAKEEDWGIKDIRSMSNSSKSS